MAPEPQNHLFVSGVFIDIANSKINFPVDTVLAYDQFPSKKFIKDSLFEKAQIQYPGFPASFSENVRFLITGMYKFDNERDFKNFIK